VITISVLVSLGSNIRLSERTLLLAIEVRCALHNTSPALIRTSQYVIASAVFYLASLIVLKLALGFFFLRLAPKQWRRHIILTAMAVSTVFSIAMLPLVMCPCGSCLSIAQCLANKVAGIFIANHISLEIIYMQEGMTALTDWISFIILLSSSAAPSWHSKTRSLLAHF
jgi:hypothetical protein